jgi:hypothetical protein
MIKNEKDAIPLIFKKQGWHPSGDANSNSHIYL